MLLKVMRTGFSAASVDLELRTDAASAIELSSRRHLDGFVMTATMPLERGMSSRRYEAVALTSYQSYL
jgi:hypothetical protein